MLSGLYTSAKADTVSAMCGLYTRKLRYTICHHRYADGGSAREQGVYVWDHMTIDKTETIGGNLRNCQDLEQIQITYRYFYAIFSCVCCLLKPL